KAEGEFALYIWRFRSDEGPWYAGASGPYQREGVPAPLNGNLTFSRFDEWEKATAEEHAQAVLENLEKWGKGKQQHLYPNGQVAPAMIPGLPVISPKQAGDSP